MRSIYSYFLYATCAAVSCCLSITPIHAEAFYQTNLASSVQDLAPVTDANLRNPWGMSFSATSPFWVSNQVTNTSALYAADGTAQSLVVTVPGGPTGQVFAGGSGLDGPSGAATFVFATLSGSLYAWNPSSGTTAMLAGGTSGAVYTGLAIGTASGQSFLYAANTKSAGIDVYNAAFVRTTLAGSFLDPNLPSGYTPYNIQNLNGLLYVEYRNASATSAAGIISVFDTSGTFQRRLASSTGVLDEPWGIVVAPPGFGTFAGALLVGNEGNGQINAFNANTGAFVGTLTDSNNKPIVNTGLWSLATRNGLGFDSNAIYFVAGINNEADGLLGRLDPVPEPASYGLFVCGLISMALAARRFRRKAVA